MRRSISIALAFVGLLVGAGFATGQEVIQYFVSFGPIGILGAGISGVIMAIAGAVILELGSYFLADEHNAVFRNVAHPIMSRIMDVSVTITLFALGFVMLAGAGSNLEQQFDLPSWIGSLIMVLIVMVTGLLDVDKVSNIISMLTPFIVVAVVGVFIYTMLNLPADTSNLAAVAEANDSPITPWWLSALNYNGLALILGVSMCLVIGGNHSDPRAARRGGLAGGFLYLLLMLMVSLVLFFNAEAVEGQSVPMLAIYDHISPTISLIMVFVIYAMIYNTCIGMYYALGRRLTASNPGKYRPVFLVCCVVGYIVSFVGFETLMAYVYPVIGYLGIVLVGALIAFRIKHRDRIGHETQLRDRLRHLIYRREHPAKKFTKKDAKRVERIAEASEMDNEEITEVIEGEVEEILDVELDDDQLAARKDEGEATAPSEDAPKPAS